MVTGEDGEHRSFTANNAGGLWRFMRVDRAPIVLKVLYVAITNPVEGDFRDNAFHSPME